MSDDPITGRVCDTSLSLLMTSGAGCGKTHRMVERYQHLVATDTPVARIVAVTFTDKAAAELKDRVRGECRKRAAEGGDAAAMWRQAARQLEAAPIGTIHGFCARLLRENALAANVDPSFRQLDEKDQGRLLRDVVRETLLRRIHAGEAPARRVVARWGLDGAMGIVRGAIGAREEHRRWLREPPDAATLLATWEEFAAGAPEELLTSLTGDDRWHEIVAEMTAIAPGISGDRAAAKHSAFLDALPGVADEDLSAEERLGALEDCIDQAGGGVGSKNNWVGREGDLIRLKGTLKLLTAFRNHAWDQMERLGTVEGEPEAELAAAICAEAAAGVRAYQQAKRERSLMDFDDLQILARDLLRDDRNVRRRVQDRYAHVLVDEFQDTNALQKEIVWYVAGGDVTAGVEPTPGKLFVVGDAKQSIYRFRGADVTVFSATEGEFDDAGSCDLVPLSESRRSTPGIVAFHNELFGHRAVMGRANAADYEADYEPLEQWRGGLEKDHEVEVILVEAVDEDDSELAKAEARRLEARALAERVRQMVEDGEQIVAVERVSGPQTPRPVRYGDIALLFRAMPDVAIYEAELRRQGVPYYTLAGRGFYHRQEIRDCLNLLGTLENASDGLALASALRSPAFAISDDALFWLTRSEVTLWQALAGELPDAITDDQRERLRRAYSVLSSLRADKNRLSLAELVERMLEETGLSAALLTQYGGLQAAANLTKLTDLARSFEAGGEFSLREFIDYLRALVTDEEREGLATIHAEAGDVVQLMTIHKAKGMQWPVVIVPDIDRRPGGSRGDLPWSPETGPVPGIEDERGKLGPGAVASLLAMEDKRREEAEARRVLYVALTRAEDHLILSSSCAFDEDGRLKSPSPWLGWIAEALHLDPPPADGVALAGDGWRGVLRRPRPGPSAWRGGHALERAELTSITLALEAAAAAAGGGGATHGEEERLRRAIEPVHAPPAELPRYHVTALSSYLTCPRGYWLRYVRDLPERAEPAGLLTDVSPTERGDLAHKVMEFVGRDGTGELDRALALAGFPGGMDDEGPGDLAEGVRWFLESDLYQGWIASAVRLRTEVPFTAVLEGAVIEGKIDALAEDADGALRLIDYKTGAPSERSSEDYRLQVGLYCAAVRAATGELPVEARLVYFDARSDVGIPPAEAAEEALGLTRRAVEGIARADFAVEACPDRQVCALAYACGLA